MFRAIGCEVIELYCEVDGNFPNHHPDPSKPENLQDLIALGEDSRTPTSAWRSTATATAWASSRKDGEIIFPDRQLMLFARDVLSRVPGAHDHLRREVHAATWRRRSSSRRQPADVARRGHSLIKAKMKETGAPLAGEMSGHFFFKERWFGFDDGIYAGAACSRSSRAQADPSAVLDALPTSFSTPELKVACAEGEPHRIAAELAKRASFRGAQVSHDRRLARRLARRLRPGARVEHHAGAGAALRRPHARSAGIASGRICWRCCAGQARCADREC